MSWQGACKLGARGEVHGRQMGGVPLAALAPSQSRLHIWRLFHSMRRAWFDQAAFVQALNEHGIQVWGSLVAPSSFDSERRAQGAAARMRCVWQASRPAGLKSWLPALPDQVAEGRAAEPALVGIERYDSQSQPVDAIVAYMKKRTRQHIR